MPKLLLILWVLLSQLAVDDEVLVQGEAGRFEHGGPKHPVGFDDVLADEVVGRRPVTIHQILGFQRRVVVDERVEPDVGDVLLVPGQGDSPGHAAARAADREVADRLAQHRQHLVSVALGADEVGVVLDVFPQPRPILLHAEEVVGFAAVFGQLVAVGAFAVDQLFLGHEAFGAHAVEPGILAVEDVVVVVDVLQDLADDHLVTVLGGADEFVVLKAQAIPGVAELGRDLVAVLLGRLVGGGRGLGDLFTVLVGAGQEIGVVSPEAMEAGDDVDQDGGVGVSDVGRGIDVKDGGGGVESLLLPLVLLNGLLASVGVHGPSIEKK